MDKNEFKRLIQEHGEISIGLNAFDPSEITATYSVDLQGRIFEVYYDNTSWYVADINDDAEMQKFEDEVLKDVVSHQYETNHFDRCVAYIKEHLEHWEIEQGWSYIGKRMGLPNGLVGRIYDLIDDFTEDNDLTDDWWDNYDVEDFFMEIDND
jgi:hypothetical protein